MMFNKVVVGTFIFGILFLPSLGAESPSGQAEHSISFESGSGQQKDHFIPDAKHSKDDPTILKPNDRISVEIFPQRELSSEHQIDEDGTIIFPYLQKIQVAGFTVDEFSKRLKEALEEKYLKNPSVTVRRTFSVSSVAPREGVGAAQQPIMVFGQIGKKGNYEPQRGSVTISEVIAASGGFLDDADGTQTLLVRNTSQGPAISMVNVPKIIEGSAPDIVVKPGDIINVPSKTQSTAGGSSWLRQINDPMTLMRTTVIPVKIFGEVNQPGSHYPLRNDVTLSEIVALQGGFTEKADIRAIKLVRPGKNKTDASVIDLSQFFEGKAPDPIIKPGDLIIVPSFNQAQDEAGGIGKAQQPIAVFGQVERKGNYEPQHIPVFLSEVIAGVGGFADDADGAKTLIIRNNKDKTETFTVDVPAILAGKAQDFMMRPGDIINVPSEAQDTTGGSNWLRQIQDPLTLLRTTVNPIKIFGEVRVVGPHYPMRNDVTLSEVIALQGGFTEQADITRIKLVRVVDGKESAEQINLYDFFNAQRHDPVLKPGDLIVVPPFQQPIQIIGEVEKPGAVNLDQFLGVTPTLIPAISKAGGFKKSAALWRVRVVRSTNNKEHSFRVNVNKILKGKKKDVVLEPGDIVVVPESFW